MLLEVVEQVRVELCLAPLELLAPDFWRTVGQIVPQGIDPLVDGHLHGVGEWRGLDHGMFTWLLICSLAWSNARVSCSRKVHLVALDG